MKVPGRRPSKRTRRKGPPWSPLTGGMSPKRLRQLTRFCPRCGAEAAWMMTGNGHMEWVESDFVPGIGQLWSLEFGCVKEEK